VDELLDEYIEIKNFHFLGKYESVITKSGKFVETVFQILKFIISGNVISDPKFNNIEIELANTQKGQFPDSIRLIIPQFAKSIYSIRSKRGAAHKSNEISPNFIDSEIIVSTCDWIISEFLRLYHNSNIEEVTIIVNNIVEKKIPLIEEFGDEVYVLSTHLSKKDQMIVILYHFYPEMVSNTDLTKSTKGSPQLTHNNLKKAAEEKLVFRENNKNKLTRLGLKKAEEIISQCENL